MALKSLKQNSLVHSNMDVKNPNDIKEAYVRINIEKVSAYSALITLFALGFTKVNALVGLSLTGMSALLGYFGSMSFYKANNKAGTIQPFVPKDLLALMNEEQREAFLAGADSTESLDACWKSCAKPTSWYWSAYYNEGKARKLAEETVQHRTGAKDIELENARIEARKTQKRLGSQF